MKNIYLTIFILLVSLNLFGQETAFKASNFKDDKDAFRLAEEKLKQGEKLFDNAIRAREEKLDAHSIWRESLSYLLEAQAFNPNYSHLNYMIARSLYESGRLSESGPYLTKAITLNPELEAYTYFLLAKHQHMLMDFAGAEDYLKQFESKIKSKEAELMGDEIRKTKLEIRYAREIAATPRDRVWVDNMSVLNSPDDELIPNIPADGSMVLYNRENLSDGSTQVMQSEKTSAGWSKPMQWDIPVFNGFEIMAISQDGQEVFLSGRADGSQDIYYSELFGVEWQLPKKMPEFKINTDKQESHASFFFDRIKFFYVTDNDYASKGGQDIFFSGKINTSVREEWGRAHPVGSELNTPYDEGSVFVHPDGKTIYFASKGHNSMGGYDIFRSERLPGRWSTPENLGYPINTPYDEIFFTISPSGKHAYLSSNRNGGAGGYDLYRVTFLGPPKPNMVDYRDHLLSAMAEPMSERSMEAVKEVDNVHLTILKGVVRDAFTMKALEASIEIIDNEKDEIISVFRSNSASGKFLVSLPAGKNYGIAVSAPDYLFHSENFNLPNNSEYQLVEKEILLKNACIGCSIVLNNIFFDVGKHTLRPESTSELNRLAALLKDIAKLKPGTRVEISGHTDNTGSENLNQNLSENRAKSVVQFLVGQGISNTMLTFKGYGSAQAVASNSTASGRQQNRRTEFKIIE